MGPLAAQWKVRLFFSANITLRAGVSREPHRGEVLAVMVRLLRALLPAGRCHRPASYLPPIKRC
jgi:hypothetical protein